MIERNCLLDTILNGERYNSFEIIMKVNIRNLKKDEREKLE